MLNVTKSKTLQGQYSDMLSNAQTLYTHATSLASHAQGESADSDEALKQKAGDGSEGTLRKLAEKLHKEASALAQAMGTSSAPGYNEANNLAAAVGANEGAGIRQKLQQLATADDPTAAASAVKQQYNTVKGLFDKVKEQAATYNADPAKKVAYEAVVKAWNDFKKVYDANLKGLATALATAVGADENSGLQQALNQLKDADDSDLKDLITKAKEVIEKFNDVADKYSPVKALADTYQNIDATRSHYENVESKFGELQQSKKLKAAASDLSGKAVQLATKASSLHGVAHALQSAGASPGSPLAALKSTAGSLKTAAKNGSTGLFKAANDLAQLARKGTDQPAIGEANQVITAFDKVETNYEELIKQAKEKKLTNDDKVTEVVKAYHSVKTIYYQMLITYRFRYLIGTGPSDGKILHKASTLHNAADSLAKAGGLTPQAPPDFTKQELIQLADDLKNAVGENNKGLREALKELSTANGDALIVAKANEVIKHYGLVKSAYEKVKEKDKEYTNLANNEYTPVEPAFKDLEKKFGALKNSYENVLKLRVQELANLAHNLSTAASALSDVNGLTEEATQLANAASDSKDGLKEKAEALVKAIKSNTVGAQATEVITAFNTVKKAYDDLANKNEYKQKLNSALAKLGQQTSLQGDDRKVKKVDTAYANLKKLYDQILNVTKIKHYAKQMESKVQSITSPATAKEVKTVIAKLKSINSLLPADPKFTVQNDIEPIKNAVYGAQFEEK